MNKHRMLPLFLMLSMILLLPLLAMSPGDAQAPTVRAKFATILAKADREAAATRASWHTKNAQYVELVSLDQR